MIRRSTGSGWNGGTSRVSILVCTIPGREAMLRECVATVQFQLHFAWELLILCDEDRQGQSKTINELGKAALGDWVLPFDDDDLMLPSLLSKLVEASGQADIVYAPPLVDGEGPDGFRAEPPNIPTPALVSLEVWRTLGGYDPRLEAQEDMDFFRRAMEIGAVFRRVSDNLWVYRIGHGGNKSRGPQRFGPQ